MSDGGPSHCATSSFHHDGKAYPMFSMGLAAFALDGPDTKLASAIKQMRMWGVYRAWTGGKAQLSNAEIGSKTAAEVSLTARSGPLLVLREWDELSPAEQYEHETMHMRISLGMQDAKDTSSYGYGPDAYRFEDVDPRLTLPYLVAMRRPTAQEMAATPDSWYADRWAAQTFVNPDGVRDGATAYTEPGCKGRSQHFWTGSYGYNELKAGIGNDTISSISVGWKQRVTLYAADHFKGQSITYEGTRAGHSDRHDLPPGLAKEVSSMTITNHKAPPERLTDTTEDPIKRYGWNS
ncbi:hypothetical protein [Streptomyces sp. ISL-94]|uniref:hypothetical protein n=1 Tax=Streptomyces sp. ISL-94 TaxID=2819190 RepID=UPI001BEB55B5|nr:hypothetical protein [Streptomyces sp. ISL-94]MBT2479572.1 hypothetical protein [Streptomyces sp. ISL-94]